MSELVPNVVDSAKVFRNAKMFGRFESNTKCIVLLTPFIAFEQSKREPKGRFFADNNMIKQGGGPWLMQRFRDMLDEKKSCLRHNQQNLALGMIEAKDLFSYRTCPFTTLSLQDRPAPLALQLVQKAELFSVADSIIEEIVKEIA